MKTPGGLRGKADLCKIAHPGSVAIAVFREPLCGKRMRHTRCLVSQLLKIFLLSTLITVRKNISAVCPLVQNAPRVKDRKECVRPTEKWHVR